MTQVFFKEEIMQDTLENFLMVKLASVLIDIKPALLLGMCNCSKREKSKNFFSTWEKHKYDIAKRMKVSFKELKNCPKGKQVFFYKKNQLTNLLKQKNIQKHLEKFGYYNFANIDCVLDKLKKHFNGKSFPHEIGLLLGYPIRDVKEFIEKKGECFVVRDRWQIYGCPKKSLDLIDAYRLAEKVFFDLILNNKYPLLFVNRISKFVTKKEEFLVIN